jgi:multidrug efflux system outer membrane protein
MTGKVQAVSAPLPVAPQPHIRGLFHRRSPGSERSLTAGAGAAQARRTGIAYASCLVAVLILGGCAVGPDYAGPPTANLHARWHRATDQKTATPLALAEWWRELRDPLLDRLMQQAVDGNLDVASAKAKIRAARALRREAIGGLLPTVEGTASATRQQTTTTSSVATTPVSNLFQAGFDASWEIDLFGAEARTVEAASANVEATRNDLDSVLLTLVGDVASTYVEARGYQARIVLARRTAKSQRETAALTRTKFDIGSASAVDSSKAAAQAASTEANIPGLESSLSQAVHRLSILIGREPGTLIGAMAKGGPIPSPRRGLPAGIPADVLANRPDIRAAERRLAQYTAKVGAAEAALYPSVGLTGSISTSAARVGDLGKASTIAWSWGPSVTIPIFEGGRLIAARDEAAAVRDQYLIAWRQSVLTALEDVENALVSLAKERSRSRSLAEAANQYRRAATLSRTLYQSGSSSFLDVLDAERSLYSAEDTLIQSRVAITTDYIALAKALGGGWTRPVDTTKPEVVDTNTQPHLRPATAAIDR